jgi:hypothetical protein
MSDNMQPKCAYEVMQDTILSNPPNCFFSDSERTNTYMTIYSVLAARFVGDDELYGQMIARYGGATIRFGKSFKNFDLLDAEDIVGLEIETLINPIGFTNNDAGVFMELNTKCEECGGYFSVIIKLPEDMSQSSEEATFTYSTGSMSIGSYDTWSSALSFTSNDSFIVTDSEASTNDNTYSASISSLESLGIFYLCNINY